MLHTVIFETEDERGVEVEFTLTGGSPGCAPSLSYPGDPPEPPELELVGVFECTSGEKVELSEADSAKVQQHIWDNIADFEDDGYDVDDHYDDWRG